MAGGKERLSLLTVEKSQHITLSTDISVFLIRILAKEKFASDKGALERKQAER